jgi:Domain of unknown function (DUF4037)
VADPPFVPGLRLAGEFYAEVVRPLLDEACPGLDHAAALLGPGSEVLGFDSPRSTDHDWGPRLAILTTGAEPDEPAALAGLLERRLPESFRGYPVFFPASRDPAGGPRHWVEIKALQPFLKQLLGFDVSSQPAGVADWLATPTQRLAEVTGGAVYHDGPGELTLARARLAWYPDQVWRYVLACQWQRIAQEEAFPGRCAEAGDELGAAVVAGRLARDLMRLCLLMSRRYPPYSKWLGSAFAALPEAAAIGPALAGALAATDAGARERGLGRACELAAARHNELGLTDPVDPRTRPYYDRPFRVLDAGRLTAALLATVTEPELRRRLPVGAIDQFADSTDALGSERLCRAAVGASGRSEP